VHSTKAVHSTVGQTIKNDEKKLWRFVKRQKLSNDIRESSRIANLPLANLPSEAKREMREARIQFIDQSDGIFSSLGARINHPSAAHASSLRPHPRNCYSDCLKFYLNIFPGALARRKSQQ
jgi:hypothetical protein